MQSHKLLQAERPGGFLDFLPETYLARENMLRVISDTFTSFGFDPIETPIIEFAKILQEDGETGKQIFSINSRGADGEELALRFDHTIPFARVLAQYPYATDTRSGIRLPWRRMVIGPVFRGEHPQNGRYRQFYQCDADIAGTDAMVADAEIITMMYTTLIALGVTQFVIRINNRKILNGLRDILQSDNNDAAAVDTRMKEVVRLLDKIDKIGIDAVLQVLQKPPLALHDDIITKIHEFIRISGTNTQKLAECRNIFDESAIAQEGIDELHEILSLVSACDVPQEYIQVDFSIARGLEYYTGPVMETLLLDAPEFGSVFSGGRYNGLVRRFTGQNIPAVGASIGVDRLFAALQSLAILHIDKKTVSEVMVLRIMPDHESFYLSLAQQIRVLGRRTEVCLLKDITFKQQFNFALQRGVRYVVICGEDEFERDVITIKDLQTRKQVEVSRADLRLYFDTNAQ